jgi:TetR/AcrR family transcriptional regulator, mexCD-oprJ operon repressor
MSRKLTRRYAVGMLAEPERRRSALQERVRDVILEGATRAVARRGHDVSMADVAAEAGVARATVYRHFPNREALLERLITRADRDAAARLDPENIGDAPVRDAVVRSIRALIELGDSVVLLAGVWRTRSAGTSAVLERMRVLMERGQETGDLRADIPAEWLADSLVATVLTVMASDVRLPREDSVQRVAALFLEGAAQRS